MTPSIVLFGNLLVDDVVFADGRTRMGQPGGAILYGALGATLWNARPGLVSPVGDDYPGSILQILLQRAVVTASVAVEGWGTDALFSIRHADAEARLQQWYGGKEARTVRDER